MAAAYAALVSLMNVIHDLQHHPPPSISIHHQPLHPITQHIIFFLDFLQSYIPPSVADDNDESADPLEMRIANAAYAAEDAIESHIVDSIQSLQNHPDPQLLISTEAINESDVMIKSINLCLDRLQTVIKEMDSIKNMVVDTGVKKKKMVVVHDQVPMKSVVASISRKETMVGLYAALCGIMEKLTGGESNLQVTPIVGMGGIGKTFLAKTIYEKQLIKDHFDICAWATISQQYNPTEILCEILSQATKKKKEMIKEELSRKSENELGGDLHKYLYGRRFLIVLDDMWSAEAWDKIQRFFPNNKNHSRVLVTTRLSQLSSLLNHDYNHHMSFLDEATSWDLFSKSVFGDKRFPIELKEIGEQIVDNCRGLPLSIVVVGGLLKKTDCTLASWKSIRDNMSSMVNMENDKHCFRLLKLSYNHLPDYLKPCFLYMGVFKEDDEIRVSMLIKMWVSEGFIKPSSDEAMKTTARGFLFDLIDRNLILIHSLGFSGRIKYCKIHDLVRDLCLKEGQKDGLYHVVGKCNHQQPQEMSTLRRVVIPMNTSKEKLCDDELRSMSNARSVICKYSDVPQNLGLLRTLHAYNVRKYPVDKNCHVNTIVFRLHVNLRHLVISVKDGDISSFIYSVSLLWNLHTLIVSCRLKTTLPSDFWKMSQFRHIESNDSLLLPNTPREGEFIIMENLRTLSGVRNFKCCEGMVERIPNLKKLKLQYAYDYSVENITLLCRLESFSLSQGFITSYNVENLTFPQSLKKLFLKMNDDFEWEDQMEKIGWLPLLETLRLFGGCFGKGKWETYRGQFPCLKYLELYECMGLEKWTVAEEESILPRLEYLRLEFIEKLKEIPLELGNIDTLKKIELYECGDEAVKCAKVMVDEQVESQGQLCFNVRVTVWNKSLEKLAGPHFEVFVLKADPLYD